MSYASAIIQPGASGYTGSSGGGGVGIGGGPRSETVTQESITATRWEQTFPITDAEGLYVQFFMPEGLWKAGDEGPEQHTIKLSAYYKLSGAGSWTHAWTRQKTAATRNPLRWEETIKEGLAAGEYVVAIVNHNTEQDEFTYFDTIQVAAYSASQTATYDFPHTATYHLQLEWTDKLPTSWPDTSVLVAGRKVRVYTDTSTYTEENSNNPAWVILDLLINERFGFGISTSDIDIQSFIDYASWCSTNSVTCRCAIDGQANGEDVIAELLVAAMARLSDTTPITISADTTDTYSYSFDEDNIVDFNFSVADQEDKVNRVVIDFLNKETNYKKDTIVVSNDNDIATTGEVRERKMSLIGCTTRAQAKQIAYLHLGYAYYSTYGCTFSVGLQALGCNVGNVVRVTHSLPGWTNKLFRVERITFDHSQARFNLICTEYSDDIYASDPSFTATGGTVDDEITTAKDTTTAATGLSASNSTRTDDNDFVLPTIDVSWTNPGTNFDHVRVWVWPENKAGWENWYETTGTSYEFDATSGRQYKICVEAVSTDQVGVGIANSPQTSITADYITPPDITFDSDKSEYFGTSVIAAVTPLTAFTGEYEIRTSDPADWSADSTGLLGRSTATTQAYATSTADSITLYGRAVLNDTYSANSASITIDKSDDAPVTEGAFIDSYSKNLLRNAGFLNTYTNANGTVRPMQWDGSGGSILVLSEVDYWAFGPYALSKDTNALDLSQTVWIDELDTAANYTLSYESIEADTHTTPIIVAEYLDSSQVQISTETFNGTAGTTDWYLNKCSLTVPVNTNYIKIWLKGDAVYDAMMLAKGVLFPQFELHNADQVDNIGDEIERNAWRAYLTRLEGEIGSIRDQLDNVEDFWTVLGYDSTVLSTQAFQIQSRAIELVAGDLTTTSGRVSVLEGRVVLGVTGSGYIANLTLGTNSFGSNVSIKADQINITGTTTFINGNDLAENVNDGTSTIDGGQITANTFIGRVGFSGALLEIDSSAPDVYRAASSEYVEPGVYIGCTAASADTDTSRFRVDLDGNIWSGHRLMSSAPFWVTNAGQIGAEDAIFKDKMRVQQTIYSGGPVSNPTAYFQATPWEASIRQIGVTYPRQNMYLDEDRLKFVYEPSAGTIVNTRYKHDGIEGIDRTDLVEWSDTANQGDGIEICSAAKITEMGLFLKDNGVPPTSAGYQTLDKFIVRDGLELFIGNATGSAQEWYRIHVDGQDAECLTLTPVSSSSVPNGSVFRDSGNSDKLSFKDGSGTVEEVAFV